VSQAKRFPKFLERRREIAAKYDAAFARDARIAPLRVPESVTSAYHLYVLRLADQGQSLDAVAARRKDLFIRLREAGIAPQVHYIPVHRQPDFRRHGLSDGDFAGSERYYAGCISIPMFPAMTDEDVEFVVSTVRRALDAQK
jgi:dTDP-4-amino-4,6-dideoxygalactose transaminase